MELGKSEVVIYSGTLFWIVLTDLLKGVIVGLILALLKLLWDQDPHAVQSQRP